MTPHGAVSGFASTRGSGRSHNQDTVLDGPAWFVVADGMGGHAAGDVASRLVAATFRNAQLPTFPRDVQSVIHLANTAVREQAVADACDGMGATVVGLATLAEPSAEGAVAVFHVGDSRCYRLVDGGLRLLTRDHSHVQELLSAGRLTTAQAERHPLRNLITRAVGPDVHVDADVTLVDDAPSRYLLCTDGVSDALDPQTIGRVLTGIAGPARAAARLVEVAIERGTRDDATALVVDIGTDDDRVVGWPHSRTGGPR